MENEEEASASVVRANGHPSITRWRTLMVYLAPAVLVTVAVQQFVLSHAYQMTPWKGGGFGMFASVDSASLRFIRAYVTVDGREIPVTSPDPDALERPATQAVTLPTAARLDRLAAALASRSWRLDPTSNTALGDSSRLAEGTRPVRPSALRLEVYRIFFDRQSLEVERLLLAEVTRELP